MIDNETGEAIHADSTITVKIREMTRILAEKERAERRVADLEATLRLARPFLDGPQAPSIRARIDALLTADKP